MSLDGILSAIRDAGQVRAAQIQAASEAEVARILADAEADAEAIYRRAYAAALQATAWERARTLHRARLEAMRIVYDSQEAVIAGVLDRLRERLAGARRQGDYPALLAALVDEALGAVLPSLAEGEEPHLLADPRDREWLEAIRRERGAAWPVSYEIETWGGVTATSADGAIVADNTLESRLACATPYLRQSMLARLEAIPRGEALAGGSVPGDPAPVEP